MAVTTSAILFLFIFAIRIAVADPAAGILFLLAVPIAVLAHEFGLLGGGIAALIATGLLAVWVSGEDVEVGPLGILTRTASFLFVGIGTGLLAAQRRRREERMRSLLENEARHASALEVHERVVQSLAVAKMALEMGQTERAASALEEALRSAQSFVSSGVGTTAGALRPDAHRTQT